MEDQLHLSIAQCPANLQGADERLSWLSELLAQNTHQAIDLLVLPELFQCGYNIGDAISSVAETADGAFFRAIATLAKNHRCAITYGYAEQQLPEADGSNTQLFNSAQCVDKTGERIAHHRKLLLPPGFEGDHFCPGDSCQIFTLGNFKIAMLICYDVEFPENVRHAALSGADLVVVPTALADNWGVVADKLIPTRAFENGVYLAYANYCDQEQDISFYGGSCIISPTGEELARATSQPTLLSSRLERDCVSSSQNRLPYLKDRLSLPWA